MVWIKTLSGIMTDGNRKFTSASLSDAARLLDDLAKWFESFGNYTRADDARRMSDGIRLYLNDISED